MRQQQRGATVRLTLKQLSFTLLTLSLAVVSGTKAAEAASLEVVADGLDNVRGLGFSPDGSLYVTESGVGGDRRCAPRPAFQGLLSCIGTSGAVTRIKDGKQERVLTELPSIAVSPTGAIANGPQDIQFDSAGNPYLLIGAGGNPDKPDFPLNSPNWGQLYSVNFNTGSLTSLADLASYELANNPDQSDVRGPTGDIASNAYTLAISDDTAYIIDAAGNDLLSVGLDGSNLTTVTVLPDQTITDPIFPTPPPGQELTSDAPQPGPVPQEIEIDSVPTGVAVGPDGALYVAELTGFPYPEGEARIYRIERDGEKTVYADGFTQLTDLEFDAEGNLYALEYAAKAYWKGNLDGTLIQIAPDGTRTTLVSGNGLESPTALTVGPDGAIYVSNKGDRAGAGQVLRIEKTEVVDEPTSFLGVLAFGALGVGSFLKRKRR